MMIPYNVVLVNRNFFSFDRFFTILTLCTKIYYNDCEILTRRCECAKNQDSFPDPFVLPRPRRRDFPRRGLLSQCGGHRPDALRQYGILSPFFTLLPACGIGGVFGVDISDIPKRPPSSRSRCPPPVENRRGGYFDNSPHPAGYVAVGHLIPLAAAPSVRWRKPKWKTNCRNESR